MTNAESFNAALKIILLKSLSLIRLAKTNLPLAKKSRIIVFSLTSQSILSSALMPENVQTNIHTTVLRNVLPSSLLSVKDVTVLLVHAMAVKDTSAAGSTSTSMKRMLHRKNMLKCSVMHVPVSTLQSMKSEISVFLSNLCWNRDSLSMSSVRIIRKAKYPKEHCIRISKAVYFRMPAFPSPILTSKGKYAARFRKIKEYPSRMAVIL